MQIARFAVNLAYGLTSLHPHICHKSAASGLRRAITSKGPKPGSSLNPNFPTPETPWTLNPKPTLNPKA